jgi:hypothetical protein
LAPLACSSRQMAAPTRLAPPVIKIVLFAKFNFYSLV